MDNIYIVPFKKQKHLQILKEMLHSQQYPEVNDMDTYSLPKIGYVAFYCNTSNPKAVIKDKIPVAIGFLRRVEGNVIAQIDGLTSNPFFGGMIRHASLSMVLDRLILDAKELKLKGLIAFCLDPNTVKRAESLGFKVINHTALAKSL